jgi:hypothetical protein
VAVSSETILLVQAEAYKKEITKGRDELIKLASDCGAVPVWTTSTNHKLLLIDL